ncbi:alpha/beta fold hydrolase [Actinoplanes sp. NPDC051494]|uniref:alpha/beta fold hydrolase n=1 Tax=Actinoplanes sp. NPDC051494 TaxID=3363907 RepID=UPI0037A4A542
MKKLLTIVAAVIALLLSPIGVTPAGAAIAMEWDKGVVPASPFELTNDRSCVLIGAGAGCFEPQGDYFYVTDRLADGHSAALFWRNYHPGDTLYRNGACFNTAGADTARICNKDMRENSKLQIRLCAADARLPDVPVLVLSGDLDANTPTVSGREAAAQFPHAEVVEVEGAGHTPAQSPEGARLTAEFLSRQTS